MQQIVSSGCGQQGKQTNACREMQGQAPNKFRRKGKESVPVLSVDRSGTNLLRELSPVLTKVCRPITDNASKIHSCCMKFLDDFQHDILNLPGKTDSVVMLLVRAPLLASEPADRFL